MWDTKGLQSFTAHWYLSATNAKANQILSTLKGIKWNIYNDISLCIRFILILNKLNWIKAISFNSLLCVLLFPHLPLNFVFFRCFPYLGNPQKNWRWRAATYSYLYGKFILKMKKVGLCKCAEFLLENYNFRCV